MRMPSHVTKYVPSALKVTFPLSIDHGILSILRAPRVQGVECGEGPRGCHVRFRRTIWPVSPSVTLSRATRTEGSSFILPGQTSHVCSEQTLSFLRDQETYSAHTWRLHRLRPLEALAFPCPSSTLLGFLVRSFLPLIRGCICLSHSHDMRDSSPRPASPQWPIDNSWIPFTHSYRTRNKLSPRPRVPILYLLSGLVLLLVVCAPLLTPRATTPTPATSVEDPRRIYSPFGDSVYKQEAYYEQLEPGTQCRPKNVFSSELPTSRPISNMGLAEETKRVAALFEYGTEDLNKGVTEFIRQMDEGLATQGTEMSQIPTYVTNVPNGTEKV